MPSLMKDEEQVKALKEINKLLEEVKNINMILTLNGQYLISKSQKRGAKSKEKSVTILVDSGVYERPIESALKQQRQKRIRDIRAKATKYRITLDKEDIEIISDDAIISEGISSDTRILIPLSPALNEEIPDLEYQEQQEQQEQQEYQEEREETQPDEAFTEDDDSDLLY